VNMTSYLFDCRHVKGESRLERSDRRIAAGRADIAIGRTAKSRCVGGVC